MKNNEVSDWTEVKNGSIDVPDELMPLFNKIGMQLRFHTVSGKSEVETIAHILWNAQKFFNTISEPIEVGSGDKAIDEIIKTQNEWTASIAEPIEPSKEEIEKMSPEETKKFIIDSALQPCLDILLHAFVLSECEEYIEAMCTNDATNKNYVLTFQTEELFKKRFYPIKVAEPIKDEELAAKFFREISQYCENTQEAFDKQSEDFAKAKKCVKIAKEYAASQYSVWEEALVSLTPSGSEFAGDPENCVRYVKEFQANQHKMICDLVKENKQLKEELKKLSAS